MVSVITCNVDEDCVFSLILSVRLALKKSHTFFQSLSPENTGKDTPKTRKKHRIEESRKEERSKQAYENGIDKHKPIQRPILLSFPLPKETLPLRSLSSSSHYPPSFLLLPSSSSSIHHHHHFPIFLLSFFTIFFCRYLTDSLSTFGVVGFCRFFQIRLLHVVLFVSEFAEEEQRADETPCDYFNGKWVRDARGPLYNGTTCGTIKEGQNCVSHGRPDTGYLYWRWKPTHCNLPRFEPQSFLQLLNHKHLAFVGDSMARNQLESLLCMLATVSTPNLVYRNGEDNKFRRWHFASHNATVSVYWSPFLVKGVEKSNSGPNHNELYLDLVDERWARDLNQIDLIVLSIGHWFLHPAVYYEGDSVLGCHYCPGLNHTEIGFYDVLRKALRTSLRSIIERRDRIQVTVTTFSPAHFEGEWDKAGACPKTEPFRKEEKELEGMDSEMRKIEVEEVEAANKAYNDERFGLEVLDVMKLALMRPDGHPGAYMYPFPFVNGVKEHVQNNCVHWCLSGPIDTWNEIFLEIIKK
ncbi:xyloglucan O-acetyltransferase 1-like [Prosopis cineraria]|uniref:xyloglucan O-acetyltransferase 1-like n=1 Tax=Prosopis cineraria TaxID=364024 RepID=UPI002410AD1C|nr:xyloglucan O-acetyltransferase 1-like [Prosopis cineraria]